MPYNANLHASLPYVSKRHKFLLDKLAEKDKRKLKDELETIIEQAAAKAAIYV